MNKVIASVGVLALGAMGVQSVEAQLTANTDKPWSISGTLRGFYDDNYNTQPSHSAEHRGTFGIEVRPQATVGYSTGPTTLNASYTYSDRYYASRPGSKNDQSHDLELTAMHSFNERYSLDLLESFVDSQEPEVVDGGLPLRASGDNFRNSAALNFHAEVTKLLGFVVGYANNFYDYTGTNPNIVSGVDPGPSYGTSLNRFEHLFTLNSRWHISEQTVGIFGYQFGAVDYLSHGSLALGNAPYVSPQARNNYSHYVYVGVEQAVRSDLSFSIRAGAQITDYYNAPANSNPSSVGPYVDLSGQYTYMDGGSLTLGFRHSKNATDVGINADGSLTQDQESSTVYATVQQVLTPLSPKLVAHLSAQYQYSRFNGGNNINNNSESFYLLGLNLTYQFTHYLSAEAGYNYDLLQSDLGGRGYDRNRVYAGITATY